MDANLSRIRKFVEALLILTLSGMVLLTFIDVIGRRLFGTPLYGAHDATEHLMAIMVFCGLPLLTAARGHLAVDLFDKYLMTPAMAWWHRLIALLIPSIIMRALRLMIALVTVHWPSTCLAWAPTRSVPDGWPKRTASRSPPPAARLTRVPGMAAAVPMATAAVPIMAWCSLPIDSARTSKSTSPASMVLPLDAV